MRVSTIRPAGNSSLPLTAHSDKLDALETFWILAELGAGRRAQVLEIMQWRGDRAVEGARLEIVCTPDKGTGGSNPPLSAI